MLEINHTSGAAVAAAPKPQAESKAPVSQQELQKAVEIALKNLRTERVEAAKPKEPDWATLSEAEASNMTVYVPVIDHEIPQYMDIKLKDPEYVAVWPNRDQRRIGQLQAEGYELLKPEHLHPDFKIPLKFNSEGMYCYEDVVAMRVHKRILFGKRRRMLELSQRQLSNNRRPPSSRIKDTLNLYEIPLRPEAGEFYDPVL